MSPIRALKNTGEYYQIMKRRGITQEQAQRAVIANTTVIGAIMVQRGEADAMICGTIGDYHEHFSVVKEVFGHRDGVHTAGAMNALLLPSGNTFIADTYVNDDPTPEQLAEIAVLAAETVRRLVSNRRWRCCRTPTLVPLTVRRPAKCATRWS